MHFYIQVFATSRFRAYLIQVFVTTLMKVPIQRYLTALIRWPSFDYHSKVLLQRSSLRPLPPEADPVLEVLDLNGWSIQLYQLSHNLLLSVFLTKIFSFFQTTDSADFLATRPHTAAVIPGKPAGNPLQFVRVGPADLGSRAREQLRRAELAKRTDPARIERQEDWQSVSDPIILLL